MKLPYRLGVFRYVHDPVTQEFVNIGVAVVSPEAGYLRARCTADCGRIARMFETIDEHGFRETMRFIEARLNGAGAGAVGAMEFQGGKSGGEKRGQATQSPICTPRFWGLRSLSPRFRMAAANRYRSTRFHRPFEAPTAPAAESSRRLETSYGLEGQYLLFPQKLTGVAQTGSDIVFGDVRVALQDLRVAPARGQQVHHQFDRNP